MEEKLQYGLRSARTGKIVRLDERTSHSEEYGIEVDSYLTFDEEHPYLQLGDLAPILYLRHGAKLWGRPSSVYYLERGMDLSEFEIVEFATRSSTEGTRDPSLFSVEVSDIEVDMVDGVWYQFPDRKKSLTKQLETVFTREEIAGMADVPSLQFVVLKSNDLDVSRAGLSGKIIVPDYSNRALANRQPMGVIDVRSAGGVTYAAITHEIWHPRFRRTISLVDGLDPHEDPWEDIQVSFGFDDSKREASDLMEEICEEGADIWPEGWEIDSTYESPIAMVILFKVEGPVRREDGRIVRKLLNDIEAGIDPREAKQASRTRRR